MIFHVRHPTPSYKIIKNTFNFPAHLKIHKKVLYDRNVFLHDSFASARTADMRFIGQTGEIPPEPGGAPFLQGHQMSALQQQGTGHFPVVLENEDEFVSASYFHDRAPGGRY